MSNIELFFMGLGLIVYLCVIPVAVYLGADMASRFVYRWLTDIQDRKLIEERLKAYAEDIRDDLGGN